MTEFSVRIATPNDLAALDFLLARSYARLLRPDYPPSVLVTALPLLSRANPALLASGTYYVACTSGGDLMGAGGWSRRRDPRTGDVRHVVTDYRHTRQGVGRSIMQRTIEDARAAGIELLDCQATRTAVPFYRALGFAELGAVDIELRPGIGFPAYRMQRRT